MDASHDLSERVDQARLVESGGAQPLNESVTECTAKENDVSATRLPGRDESLQRGVVDCKTLQR